MLHLRFVSRRRAPSGRSTSSGSIAVEAIETELSDRMERAVEAAQGSPADAVVWEEVTKRTSESADLSVSFALFMILAVLIAAVGILPGLGDPHRRREVVGPEFGPSYWSTSRRSCSPAR